MEKRIAPRLDRKYFFSDSGKEFILSPYAVNAKHEIVFYNELTGNKIHYTLDEFIDLYKNCLLFEEVKEPRFLKDANLRKANKFYAIKHGWADYAIVAEKKFLYPYISDYEDAVYATFPSFEKALEYLNTPDANSSNYCKIKSELENELICLFRKLSPGKQETLVESLRQE